MANGGGERDFGARGWIQLKGFATWRGHRGTQHFSVPRVGAWVPQQNQELWIRYIGSLHRCPGIGFTRSSILWGSHPWKILGTRVCLQSHSSPHLGPLSPTMYLEAEAWVPILPPKMISEFYLMSFNVNCVSRPWCRVFTFSSMCHRRA